MRSAALVIAPDVFAHARPGPASSMADSIVGGMFAAATSLATPLARLDAVLRPTRTAHVRAALSHAHDGRTDGAAELRAIWFTRTAREGLRILLALGFADAVLRRVEVTGGLSALRGNCVYAIYHTPWGRVLALWMERQSHGALLSAQRWMSRAGKAHVPCTWRGMRGLVNQIGRGGVEAATRRLTSVFDAELRRDPSGWEQAHRFLSVRQLLL